MKTNIGGLIELECGWYVGVGACSPGRVKVTFQFDPNHELPSHGVKVLNISEIEAQELEEAFHNAREEALTGGGDDVRSHLR